MQKALLSPKGANMVDKTLINRKVILLLQLKKELLNYGITSLEEFKKNQKDQKATQKSLQEMIEICMDIGKHIISDQGFIFPEDGKAIFTILEDNNVLSKKVTKRMHNMVGFRNVIVHLYERVDLEIVYGVYKKHLKDFDLFIKEINNYLE